ncbi:MAG TPA: class I SAM-dependent methyltransferase, partial [Gammaproteobacteria bacterium]
MMNSDSYDAIPYDSTPFADSHPNHLCVLGRLFGLATPAPETARILELGCASGGNIIPLAYYLPKTQIVGIELSTGQVAVAQQLIGHLGLRNIEVRQGDIMALGDELGEFDYIIAHGVYSWVPEAVRSRILELCRKHLSPHGVAYLSYNTLPGWRMRGTLRDMLLHHTRTGTSPRERLALAYQLFDLLEQALVHDEALPARYLRSEIAGLRKSHPSYLYHEYLEEINQPFLFSAFVADANRHGLNYLSDVELANDIPSTLGGAAAEALASIDGLIEQGQYGDFIANRTFRRSLVVHAEAPLHRELSLQQLANFAYSAHLVADKGEQYRVPRSQSFRSATGQRFEVEHPLTKAALTHLAEHYPDASG